MGRWRFDVRLPADVQRERTLQLNRRSAKARTRAARRWMRGAPDDVWRGWYLEELAKVNAERGPLPGDDLLTEAS